MRSIIKLLFTLIILLTTVSIASAEELKVEPKISKFNTSVLFENDKQINNRQLIIKFKPSIPDSAKESLLESIKVKELSNSKRGEFTLVSVPGDLDLKSLADTLLKNKFIEFVEPNYQLESAYTPKDPAYNKQWYLKKVQAPKAWDQTKGASNITVAVVDEGVQISHPDLKGKIVSPYNIPLDSTHISPEDHGTHVAGIIAATMNKTGISGISPNVKIMPVNVFYGNTANTYDVADGIYYAVDRKADIINLSLGSYNYSYALDYAVSYANSKGVIVVAAAGNDRTYQYTYPAALENVIGVSATDRNDTITGFSNYGSYIDFSAPGLDIYSTLTGSSYGNMNGTSMAAPVVSGVTALILSKNPFLSPAQVESILIKSSSDKGRTGWDAYYGYGRVDAYKALTKTPLPVHSLSFSKNTYTMNGTNKNTVAFQAQGGTKVSLYIQNSKGKTVRKLIVGKRWSGGKVSASWDGKQDNGTFVSQGSYKILAKVTNGEETVYKSKVMKVVDKIVPSIKLSNSAVFSPSVKGKLQIPYQVNKPAKINAVIYDRNKKEVKRLLTNSNTSAGKKTIYWDGKNSKGKKVLDGKYSLVMSIVDSNKVKGITRKMPITVDSKKPVGKASLYSSILKVDGKTKTGAKITFNEAVYADAYITTDKGVKVKKLVNSKLFKAGSHTLSWNGKNDKGQFVGEGKYLYLVEYKDTAGNKTYKKSSLFTLQDWIKPTVKASSKVYYKTKAQILVPYTTSKAGKVTVQVLQSGKIVRTIQSNVLKSKGKNYFVWDGRDQAGNYLKDATYQYKVTIIDKYKQTNFYTGNLIVALTKVAISYPKIVQFYQYEDIASEVFYKLSQPASVTIEIQNQYEEVIKTILANVAVSQGINSFQWNGRNDEGWMEYDDVYYYVIKAKNAAGNTTTIKGKMSAEENPEWLITQKYSFTPSEEYYWLNKQLNLEIDVNKQVNMFLYVFNSTYNDEFFDQREYSLKNGINKIVYDKTDTQDLYYILEYVDEMGNSYSYEINESYYYSSDYQALSIYKNAGFRLRTAIDQSK